jgi:hypothetical protein
MCILFFDKVSSRDSKGLAMATISEPRGMRVAAAAALVAWVATLVAATVVAGVGVAGLAGWSDGFVKRVALVPGTDLVTVDVAPTWEVVGGGQVCQRFDLRDRPTDCYGLMFRGADPEVVGGVARQGEVRAVQASLRGPLTLDAEPGWNPLIASLFLMTVLSLLVLALVLNQLWRLLRAAAAGEPFTDQVVRRLRVMGGVLVGWELAEPVLWLFLSPKAWEYGATSYGPGATADLQLGSMEPGGPQLTVIAFGLLLVLLAQVFRRGVELADEQRLTV